MKRWKYELSCSNTGIGIVCFEPGARTDRNTCLLYTSKVDRYKQEKANRKKNMKKQRIMNIVRKCVLSLAALALVGWLGYSAYVSHESKQEREVAEVNYDAVNNYLSGLGE